MAELMTELMRTGRRLAMLLLLAGCGETRSGASSGSTENGASASGVNTSSGGSSGSTTGTSGGRASATTTISAGGIGVNPDGGVGTQTSGGGAGGSDCDAGGVNDAGIPSSHPHLAVEVEPQGIEVLSVYLYPSVTMLDTPTPTLDMNIEVANRTGESLCEVAFEVSLEGTLFAVGRLLAPPHFEQEGIGLSVPCLQPDGIGVLNFQGLATVPTANVFDNRETLQVELLPGESSAYTLPATRPEVTIEISEPSNGDERFRVAGTVLSPIDLPYYHLSLFARDSRGLLVRAGLMAPPNDSLQAGTPWSFDAEWTIPCGVADEWPWFEQFRFPE